MKNKLATAAATGLGMLASSPAFAQINTSRNFNGFGTNDPETILVNIVNWGLGILALIAVVLVLIGGFQWMTAAGDETKVDKAKKVLVAAVIGLVIVMAAWGISLYAISVLANATNASVV